MKVKVRETTNIQLNWMVAKCLASVHKDAVLNGTVMHGWWISALFVDPNYWISLDEFTPTTNWSQGGPLLSKERISRTIDHSGLWIAYWTDGYTEGDEGKLWMQCDRSELVAGLRCYVMSELGEEVEVPDELCDLS